MAACAASVLSVPATVYLEAWYLRWLGDAAGLVLAAGLVGFVVVLCSRAVRRAVGVSLFAVISLGALAAALAVPLTLPRDRLLSEGERARQCARFRNAVSPFRTAGAARIAVRDAPGLPAPEGGGRPMFLTEPWTTQRVLAIEVTTAPLDGGWIGWYAVEPDEAGHPRLALLALDAERPADRRALEGWVLRHEIVAARWIAQAGDRLLLHRDEADGTLELRDRTLAVRVEARGVGSGERHLSEAFPDGEGGLYYLEAHGALWHLPDGGPVTRRAIAGVPTDDVDALSARPDGLCLRTAEGVFVLAGDPLRPVPLELAVVARDQRLLLLPLGLLLLAVAIALLVLRRPLATLRALGRAPLVGRLRDGVLIDAAGAEHPIARVERWLNGEPSPGDEVRCVALVARAGDPSAGGPYRASGAPLVLSLVIRGSLPDARALARARLLAAAAAAGYALLVVATACLTLALVTLLGG